MKTPKVIAGSICNNVYHGEQSDQDGLCAFCRDFASAIQQERDEYEKKLDRIRGAIEVEKRKEFEGYDSEAEDAAQREMRAMGFSLALSAFDSARNEK